MKNENPVEDNKENLININLEYLNKIKSSLSDPIYQKIENLKEKLQQEDKNPKKKLDLCIKQLSLSKIAVNIHNLDPLILINAHMDLANLYASLNYTHQSFEHFRQSLKTHYIYFKLQEELFLKFQIYSKLIESCYLLKSYNQTLSYIQDYYNLLNKNEVKNISSLSIELIHAKTLYALNDFEKSEKQFLIALNMLNKELELIVKLNESNKNFSRNNFIFEQKSMILDFLYKIKIKEDNLKREQIEIINQILELCEKGQKENISNKDLLFKMKANFILKKISLIEDEGKITKNFDDFENFNFEEIKRDGPTLKNNVFINFVSYLKTVLKENPIILKKNNSKILNKSLHLCKKNLSNFINKDFNIGYDIIMIIQQLDKFFFGELSKNIAKNNFIEAFLMIQSSVNPEYNYIKNLLKQALKISRQYKMDNLYKNTQEFLKNIKSQHLPVFDFKIFDNY